MPHPLLRPHPSAPSSLLQATKASHIPRFHGWHNAALPVPPAEYERRLAAVQQRMVEENIDILVLRGPEDVLWLTGFRTIGDSEPQTVLVPGRTNCSSSAGEGEPVFIARLIECDLVFKYSWVRTVLSCPDAVSTKIPLHVALKTMVGEGACRRQQAKDEAVPVTVVGVQLDQLSASYFSDFEKRLSQQGGQNVLSKDASKIVEEIRLQRSDFEIACIRKAAAMGEKAMAQTISAIKPGVALSLLQAVAMAALFEVGSEPPSYQPHHRSRRTWRDPAGHGSWELPPDMAGSRRTWELGTPAGHGGIPPDMGWVCQRR